MDSPPPAAPRRLPTSARRAVVVAVLALFASLLAAPGAGQASERGSAQGPGQGTDEPTDDATRIREETLDLAPDAPPSPDDVFVDVVEARQVLQDTALTRVAATDASTKARTVWFGAAAAVDAARTAVDEATDRRDATKAQLAEERGRLSDITVRAYVTGGDIDAEEYRALVSGDTTDPAHGRAVVFEQVLERQEEVTDQARKDANTARIALNSAREDLSGAKDEAARRAGTASERARAQAAAERAHIEAGADEAAAQVRLRSGVRIGLVPEEVAIIGVPRLNAGDLAGWFAGSGYVPRVPTPIEDYAGWFIEEGTAEGIRGDIAFAQAVLETDGFANTDSVIANNFSGIGHCDVCPSGWTFPSPQLGVRAQIQLLKSYAVRPATYVNDLVDRRLRGPAGCCETWGDLTTVWATDPAYGPKVMLIYTAIVDHALARRAAAPPTRPT